MHFFFAKFQRIIRVKNFYADKYENRPQTTVQGRLLL